MKCYICDHDDKNTNHLGLSEEYRDNYNPVFFDVETGLPICQQCFDAGVESLREFEIEEEHEEICD